MYLHPLIHSELTRQNQAGISRRALRATLTGDRDRQLLPSRGPAKRIRKLIASFATLAVR